MDNAACDTAMTHPALGPGHTGPGSVPGRTPGAGRRRTPRLGIALIAAGAFAAEMAVSARYGYSRDELYFLAAGKHPAWGYVDQPPMTPLLARAAALLTGNTLAGLRIVPALALAAMVVLTAAVSRQLGAGRAGQLIAALATATCAEYLGAMHELTTTVPDFVFWALTLLLTTRLLISRDPRWWLAVGGCAGVAAEAKWNIAFLLVSILAGFALTPARRLLASRWLLAGAALAVALAAPDLIWQAAHGWPDLAVFRALDQQAGHNRIVYWPAQIVYTGLATTPVWIGGLIWTLRGPQGRPLRPLGLACALVITLQFVLGGKPYYPGGAYVFLFAAGAVPLGQRLAERAPWHGISPLARRAGVLIAVAAIGSPVSLPILPARTLATVPLQDINSDLGEQLAWPRLTALMAAEYHRLPAAQQARTAVLTGNYGEAGAIDRYGAAGGLPAAYSGANNFWLWGPPPAADTSVLAINVDPALLRREFTRVRQVATFRNGLGVSDQEQGAPVYLATGLRTPWPAAWPAFRDYS